MNLALSLAWRWGIALVLYSALIFWLSSAPRELPLPELPLQDKLIHLAAYGLLASIAIQWLAKAGFGISLQQVAIGTLYAILYGASDEWHQSFVPGRDSNVADWMADGVGALAVALFLIWRRRSSLRPI